MKYKKLGDGRGFTFNSEEVTLKMACCDCGLVHYMGVTILEDKNVSVGFKRDSRATGQLRRHNYGNLSQDGKLLYWLKSRDYTEVRGKKIVGRRDINGQDSQQ